MRRLVEVTLALWLVAVVSGCGDVEMLEGSDTVSADAPGPDAPSADVPSADVPGADITREDVSIRPDVPVGECCGNDTDCGAGEVCVGAVDGGDGSCVPAPAEGQCYGEADCHDVPARPGERATITCEGGAACGCRVNCISVLGECVTSQPECCATDADCDIGEVCANPAPGQASGRCVAPAEGTACWSSGECGVGEACEGVGTCGCGLCGMAEVPGQCRAVVPPECCASDAECGNGFVCVGRIEGQNGACAPGPAVGECYADADCASGPCEGGAACGCLVNCLSVIGTCAGTPGDCCTSDADCDAGEVCANGSPGEARGACRAPAPGTACWSNGECPEGEVCDGVRTCGCVACGMAEGPGTCRPSGPPGCCASDEDCGPLDACVGVIEGGDGSCVPRPEAGTCYVDADCGEGVCVDGMACGCNVFCLSMLGQCVSTPPGCCAGDEDCGPLEVCVGVVDGGDGSCAPRPEAGTCYVDADCAEGVCLDGMACGCNVFCFSALGTCGALPAGCCARDADCSEGEVCGLPIGATGAVGRCSAPAEGEACWSDVECARGTSCVGEQPCPCNVVCDGEWPGYCMAGCCGRDADCGAEEVCVGALGADYGTCLPKPAPGGCYSDADCGGVACVGGYECGCNVDCISQLGRCEGAEPPACCATDAECGRGYACVGQIDGEVGSCVREPALGECYSDADCNGHACVGGAACGCTVDCMSQLGTCAVDGCCTRDAECDDGEVCALPIDEGGVGTCKERAVGDECWSDTECPDGVACVGESVCDCRAVCIGEFPGYCMAGCCATDADCGAGEVCLAAWMGDNGSCVAAPAPGECYSDADCGGGYCDGGYACACNVDCMSSLGTCRVPAPGCCMDDADCPEGEVCAPSTVGVFEGLCRAPAPGDACWSGSECPFDYVCVGIESCGCADCDMVETPGVCELLW